MRNVFLSIGSLLLLILSINHLSFDEKVTEIISTEDSNNTCEEEISSLEDFFSCNMTFSSSQDFSCCNTTNDGCACVNMTVNGLYGYGCQSTVTDIWFESMFLCSQGQWSGTSPTIQIDLDLYQACPGSCGTVFIPVTMKYTYNCGYGTCQGSYSRMVRMLIC